MSNFVILCAAAGLFWLSLMVDGATQSQFYQPLVSRFLNALSWCVIVIGSVWAPFQNFDSNGQFAFMNAIWAGIGFVGVSLRNNALRRAAINQEHYESLRAGIEKIRP